jgi:catechol 2,3-dioxygenase-like lactoylglutathione lyase family enzyme
MIGYVTLGSNDLPRARAFYDALLGEIGAGKLMELETGFTLYGKGPGKPGIALVQPFDGQEAHPGNGTMVAIPVRERAQVDALHARALELGAADEGKPGLRVPEGPDAFYGAYFRDLDGNKLCVFRMGPA